MFFSLQTFPAVCCLVATLSLLRYNSSIFSGLPPSAEINVPKSQFDHGRLPWLPGYHVNGALVTRGRLSNLQRQVFNSYFICSLFELNKLFLRYSRMHRSPD
jgi:hypothetical protein